MWNTALVLTGFWVISCAPRASAQEPQPVSLLIKVMPSKEMRDNPDWPGLREKINAAMAYHGFEVCGHNVSNPWEAMSEIPELALWADVYVIVELVLHKKNDNGAFTIAAQAVTPSDSRKIAIDTRVSENFPANDPAEKNRVMDTLVKKTCAEISRDMKLTLNPPKACGRHMWVVVNQPPKNFDFKLHRLMKKHTCWQALIHSTKDNMVVHIHTHKPSDELVARLKTDLSREKSTFTIDVKKETILIQAKQ